MGEKVYTYKHTGEMGEEDFPTLGVTLKKGETVQTNHEVDHPRLKLVTTTKKSSKPRKAKSAKTEEPKTEEKKEEPTTSEEAS